MKIEYSNFCNEKLFSLIPELIDSVEYKDIIKDALEDQRLSAHGIYEDALCPFVLDLIQKNDRESKKKIEKIFHLIEEIARNENFYISNVAYVSFIEPFIAKVKPMKDATKYLEPKSLEMAREIAEDRYGCNARTWEKEE